MENTTQPQTPEQEAPQLTLADLTSLKNIIDAACQRGAFRANEMKSVGDIYNRLDTFLTAVTPPGVTPPIDAGITPIQEPVQPPTGDQ